MAKKKIFFLAKKPWLLGAVSGPAWIDFPGLVILSGPAQPGFIWTSYFLGLEEDLLHGQDDDLLLPGQDDDLLLGQEEDFLLGFFLARIDSGRPLGQPGGGLNLEMLGGQPGWSVGRPAWLAGAAASNLGMLGFY